MDFEIILAGINHKVAGVDLREKYSLASYTNKENWAFNGIEELQESLILSTCNRVEVLAVGKPNLKDKLLSAWMDLRGGNKKECEHYFYIHKGHDAIEHVFNVASSLDSMVLGEPQILGQFKEAYRKALSSKNCGPILNRLMQTAFYVAKRVRNETSIGSNAVSVSYAAVELAKCIFGNLKEHDAFLLGAGEMAELAALNLTQSGIRSLTIATRTFAHAESLAQKYHAKAVPFENLEKQLSLADIVITSTSANNSIIDLKYAEKIMRARKNRPIFFIDIAVPRDIEPEVNSLDNIYLYDIDDLREIVEKNRLSRQKEAFSAARIIKEETRNFNQWLQSLEFENTILNLIKFSNAACDIEINKTMRKLGNNSPEMRSALEKMAKALAARLNHGPLTWLKSSYSRPEEAEKRINALSEIFGLETFSSQPKEHK